MLKIKHARTADCVVAGFRWHKSTSEGGAEAVGSLLLGLYDDAGVLHHVGVTSSFTHGGAPRARRRARAAAPRCAGRHPWRDWAEQEARERTPASRRSACPARPAAGAPARTSSWQPLRPERVCEVKYDHLQGDRFRHATTFLRWRLDKPPTACRYDQLEVVAPYALKKIFAV